MKSPKRSPIRELFSVFPWTHPAAVDRPVSRGTRLLLLCLLAGGGVPAAGQTLIHPTQIEDAYLRNTGDVSTGDILAPTSEISAATLSATQRLEAGNIPAASGIHVAEASAVIAGPLRLLSDRKGQLCGLIFGGTDAYGRLYYDGDHVRLISERDIYIDPTDSGKVSAYIVPMATMQFQSVLDDKIQFYGDAYAIAVSPFDLDIRSDRNIKFHSDTVEDLFQILGDEGNITAKNNITAGGDIYATTSFRFAEEQPGDKVYLYYPQYKISISPGDVDFYTDQYIKFHSDSNDDAGILDADSGDLTLEGRMKSPTAVVGATDTPGYKLAVEGTLGCQSLTEYSLSRFKTEIQDPTAETVQTAKRKLSNLKIKKWRWRDEYAILPIRTAAGILSAKCYWRGPVADDPSVDEDYRSYDRYGNLQGILPSKVLWDSVLVIQDLIGENETLKWQVATLEARVETLEAGPR